MLTAIASAAYLLKQLQWTYLTEIESIVVN